MNTKELSFNNFKLTWVRDNKSKSLEPIDIYYGLTPEIIEKYKIQEGIEITYSIYLLEKNNKKALFDAGFGNYDIKPGYALSRLTNYNKFYLFLIHSLLG